MLAGPCRFQGSRNSQIAVSSVVDMRLRVKELVEGRPFLWRSLSLGWGPTAEMVDLDASENRNSAVARVGDDRCGESDGGAMYPASGERNGAACKCPS